MANEHELITIRRQPAVELELDITDRLQILHRLRKLSNGEWERWEKQRERWEPYKSPFVEALLNVVVQRYP